MMACSPWLDWIDRVLVPVTGTSAVQCGRPAAVQQILILDSLPGGSFIKTAIVLYFDCD